MTNTPPTGNPPAGAPGSALASDAAQTPADAVLARRVRARAAEAAAARPDGGGDAAATGRAVYAEGVARLPSSPGGGDGRARPRDEAEAPDASRNVRPRRGVPPPAPPPSPTAAPTRDEAPDAAEPPRRRFARRGALALGDPTAPQIEPRRAAALMQPGAYRVSDAGGGVAQSTRVPAFDRAGFLETARRTPTAADTSSIRVAGTVVDPADEVQAEIVDADAPGVADLPTAAATPIVEVPASDVAPRDAPSVSPTAAAPASPRSDRSE